MLVSISSVEDSVSWLRIVSCNSTCRTAEFVERQEQGFGELNRYKIKGKEE